MTDEQITPSPEDHLPTPIEAVAEPVVEPAPAPASQRGGTPLWLTLLLVVIVAAEPFVVPKFLPRLMATLAPPPAASAASSPDLGAITTKLATLDTAVAGLKLRLASLETTPAASPSAPSNATDSVRLDALESRIATLEKQPTASADVSGQVAAASVALEAKIAALDAEIQKDVTQTTARAEFANRLRAATAALQAGQPLGDIPGAGPALTRFATTAPPTEPALRLSYEKYEDLARSASQPLTPSDDKLGRAWERVEALVTIRKGDHVLVGSPASVILEAAHAKLDAGDLGGAVNELDKLDAAAKNALAPWTEQAKTLLDARSALLALVAKS